jgi:hypothetical protein
MAENFAREYEKLGGVGVMGIFGTAHTDTQGMNRCGSAPSMANQLFARYGDKVRTEE